MLCLFRSCAINLICLFVLLLGGCGDANRQALAPVTGTVTVGGKPLEHGQIVFSSGKRPAIGKILRGNIFEVTTYTLNDGAPVGAYPIGIAGYPPLHDMYAKVPPSSVPHRFSNPETSKLRVEIKAGQINDLHFDLNQE